MDHTDIKSKDFSSGNKTHTYELRCYRRSSLVSRQLETPEEEPENNHFHIHRKTIIFALLQMLEELENYGIDSETNVSFLDQDDLLNFESQTYPTQEARVLV